MSEQAFVQSQREESFEVAAVTIVVEALRINTEIARSIVERIPQVLDQSTRLLRELEAHLARTQGPVPAHPPRLDPALMTHFIAIQERLTPDEAALARAIAARFTADELRAWLTELMKLNVTQGAQNVRVLIAGNTEAVS